MDLYPGPEQGREGGGVDVDPSRVDVGGGSPRPTVTKPTNKGEKLGKEK